jgi:hypothetical protein
MVKEEPDTRISQAVLQTKYLKFEDTTIYSLWNKEHIIWDPTGQKSICGVN